MTLFIYAYLLNITVDMATFGKLNYQCGTSVAPQLLQTATVSIHHEELDEADDEGDMYKLLPHLLVMSGQVDGKDSYCTAYVKNDINDIKKYKDAVFSGVALEPIVDGKLAKSNPQSTAKTAVAVGGVVSIAIEKDDTDYFDIGDTVYINPGEEGGYMEHERRLVLRPLPDSDSITDMVKDYPGQVVGTVVDNSQAEEEFYIRVKLV